MSEGLTTTFQLLGTTDNEAAVWVLIPALDSPNVMIRDEALVAILKRRNVAGHREILRRLHLLDERNREVIGQHHGRMTQAMRDALVGSDAALCTNACMAAAAFRNYDLIPTLISVVENKASPNAAMASKTLQQLVEQLYGELAEAPRSERLGPLQTIRNRVVGDLEQSVTRFGRHRRREIIEAFVLLVHRDNATLKQILMDPHHAAFVAVVEALAKIASGGVIRLLLSFLDDPHAPSVALVTIAKRSDRKFIEHLLSTIGADPSLTIKQNLKRITAIQWVQSQFALLDDLDEQAQQGAVRLAMHAGIPRAQAFAVVEHVLRHGYVGARRVAAEVLREFPGAAANGLALQSLQNDDPQVQAQIVLQLRSRGIPGALPHLVEMVDSPHQVVREAARESLGEFTFKRFLAAFDMLDDEVRQSTGALVKKIDPQALPLLEAELASPSRARRVRGMAIAQTIDAVPQVEASIVRLLHDEDHLVRAHAAAALAAAKSMASLDVLQNAALDDRSPAVQMAARKSLNDRAELSAWSGANTSVQGEEALG